ncbi:Fe(3+)-hydroxamate ABC transporter permease FhuB [Mesorhizobium sp.]|uniref:Fe(3+)-hydroxamate ABC transporter permease FhuB n=1 Tax=Mesorhizobium sp. TaxID=1871066 RepID=UPI000FE841D2|nr:Fe(3+)-hydroxamate ABC transporter permease FhuB [Mesorhizobium sp.]RWM21847.1 MAG: Fe(3+)-hydroxamate ABC transporter permease FhuB [Mesorhizobium sp.]RWM33287.1 MAG: Fe(3+)-hydroxamate ABC transporter permease FhuB [Mesorhizobium sp.]TIO72479.1 MAG: Fe(3+)-hydroxamate ABC transporter permease FhuB [Mesorhizobium sp.]TIO80644.1 MAG: Fe(3+)-hydroxamate ABC transporter permease FhuB [Mesorhizobium sp.]TJV48405.1 MAG: Fe(3+)-hydroxamate ABC transporter permease FhuB [Mesorhizobium sp.]
MAEDAAGMAQSRSFLGAAFSRAGGRPLGALLLCAALTTFGLAASLANLAAQLPPSLWLNALATPNIDDMRQVLVHYAFLPRLVVSLLCGAALGLAGGVLQQVLRNPLASPETVGVSAGAYLALALATLTVPSLLAFGREWVALAGAFAALAAVLALSWHKGLSPFSVVLAGLVVSLYAGAIGAALVVLNHEWLAGLFIWGAGSLGQQDWVTTLWLLPRLGAAALAIGLMTRPLTLLGLEDEGARSLGVPLGIYRFAGLGMAVALIAFVVAAVGVIGFVGLAAAALARIGGARRLGQRLVMAPLLGSAMLWAADQAVQLATGPQGDLLPTGAITALLGAPLLLWLLPRLSLGTELPLFAAERLRRIRRPGILLAAIGLALLLLLVFALFCGPAPDGWSFAVGDQLQPLLSWRWPRVLAALSAGAMLALAGLMMQRLTGNPMASPEVLGISAGAALGMVVAMFSTVDPSHPAQTAAAAIGAFATLLAVLAIGRRAAYAPARLLLAGVSLTALFDALILVLTATGDPRAMLLINWLTGSTYGVDQGSAVLTASIALCLLLTAPLFIRWLDMLPLGAPALRSLGVDVARARLLVLLMVAVLTAASTLILGPLTFIGLMAPHLARRLGLVRALPQAIGAVFAGALIMVLADWIGRTVIFPRQIPAGLVATLIGGPVLMALLRRR